MSRAHKRYLWNNEAVAGYKTVDGWLILPGGIRVKREAAFMVEDDATFCDLATIGASVIIGAGALIGYRAAVGAEAVISRFVCLGEGVQVGKHTVIGKSGDLDVGANIGSSTSIGSRVVVGRGSRIGDSCIIGDGVTIGKQVIIRNRAILGDGVTIADGVHLGSRVNIAPNSHITSTPISIQGPRQLATLVSPTEVQIGMLVLPFTLWFESERQEAAFRQLGIDGEFAQVYVDILEFMEAHAADFAHLSFGG